MIEGHPPFRSLSEGTLTMPRSITRRDAMLLAGMACAATADESHAAAPPPAVPPRPFLTPDKDFGDVSRGNPIPHKLRGEALVKARLTPETWRLEIVAEGGASVERSLRTTDGTALDHRGLLVLGEKHGVRTSSSANCSR
jgi:hypothetical protein